MPMKDNNKIYYIAHPYTDDEVNNALKVNECCNKLIDLGYIIFSPISMNHPLHQLQKRNKDFWYSFDLKFLERCDGIIMCPEWEGSLGCQMEMGVAISLDIEILFYDLIINGELK